MPCAGRNDRLRPLAIGEIGAEPERGFIADAKQERGAGIEVQDLDGIDPMPLRTIPARQQKIDRRRCRALAVDRAGIAEGLAEMPASESVSKFGWRLR